MLANCKTGFEIAWNSIIEPIVYLSKNESKHKKIDTKRLQNEETF